MGDVQMRADATLWLMRPAAAGLRYQIMEVHRGTVRSCLDMISETSKLGQAGWYIETRDGERIYEAEIDELLKLQCA